MKSKPIVMKNEIRRLVIDVNIWVKWASNKRIGIWLETFGEFGIELFGSNSLIEELNDVLSRPFFQKISSDHVDTKIIIQELNEVLSHIKNENLIFNCPDPDDEYLIEIAWKSNAILVTNDKALLDWKESPIEIISLDNLRSFMNNLLIK